VGFRLFRPSYDRTKNLTEENIKHAFGQLGVPLTSANAKLILKRYDSDRDGEVTFSDICDIFKPRDPALAKEFSRRLPFDHKKTEDDLSYETKACLRTLFHKTLQVEQNIELLKLELQRNPEFDLTRAFEVINRQNKSQNDNFISMHEFKQILRTHGVYTLDRDIKNLFDRFDKDRDGRIGF